MTPEERKAKTENLLRKHGIPFLPSLPCIESEEQAHLRSPRDVGLRILCLFCVVGTAFDPGDTAFREYLRNHGLWEHLTPEEVAFLTAEAPDRKSVINFTWRLEALFLLMWACSLVEVLPLPRQEADGRRVVSRLPGVDQSPWPFVERLGLRAKAEILDASDLIYRVHWAAREAALSGGQPPAGLNRSVVQEWHHAINWLTRYDDLEWDLVTTDT
jgi:hypothetical protein